MNQLGKVEDWKDGVSNLPPFQPFTRILLCVLRVSAVNEIRFSRLSTELPEVQQVYSNFTHHVSRFTDFLSRNNQIHTTTDKNDAENISQGERFS